MSETRTVSPSQARKSILKAFAVNRPIFLWGPPGIGKSEIVAGIAKELGGPVVDLRLSQMDPTDIRGVPFYNRDLNKMDWAPPIDLPTEEFAAQYPTVVLFLDEMNSAPPSVQAAAYQLVLDRRIGTYRLPDNVVIAAAGNRDSDKGVTYRMASPLANRLIHQEVKVDFNSWVEWATANAIHPDVIGYLEFAKQDLYDFDAKSASRSFATPRSWSFVSQLLQDDDCDNETLTNLIAGTVGEGLAVKFMTHRKFSAKLPKPEDILSGKVKTLEVKEISAMYSLVTSLCYQLQEFSRTAKDDEMDKLMDTFIQFMMDNFETEIIVMGIRVGIQQFGLPIRPTKLKTFKEFNSRYGKFVLRATVKGND